MQRAGLCKYPSLCSFESSPSCNLGSCCAYPDSPIGTLTYERSRDLSRAGNWYATWSPNRRIEGLLIFRKKILI